MEYSGLIAGVCISAAKCHGHFILYRYSKDNGRLIIQLYQSCVSSRDILPKILILVTHPSNNTLSVYWFRGSRLIAKKPYNEEQASLYRMR